MAAPPALSSKLLEPYIRFPILELAVGTVQPSAFLPSPPFAIREPRAMVAGMLKGCLFLVMLGGVAGLTACRQEPVKSEPKRPMDTKSSTAAPAHTNRLAREKSREEWLTRRRECARQ